MKKSFALLACSAIFVTIVALTVPSALAQKRKPGTYATLQTSMGNIVCELYEKEAPITVKNFVDLAEGNKEYKDPKTGQTKKGRYYDGTVFHRVIPEFMIQGGDPTGTGMGGPGYKFQNESSPNINFDKAGRLAMANSGPNTNGSQFFITEGPVGLAAKDYTIFGQVVEGLDVVKKIARVPKVPGDREQSKPVTPPVLQKVVIERVPAS
ncbi:MAG: peptidylprolyl isomerase [Acidobacteria bacterium]|nr:peptidylprolyl isomerase [Acidobacteriota bacterium]